MSKINLSPWHLFIPRAASIRSINNKQVKKEVSVGRMIYDITGKQLSIKSLYCTYARLKLSQGILPACRIFCSFSARFELVWLSAIVKFLFGIILGQTKNKKESERAQRRDTNLVRLVLDNMNFVRYEGLGLTRFLFFFSFFLHAA